MVFIIKKMKNETYENLLKRVSAIMINMEYNHSIYNIEKGVNINDKTDGKFLPFNTFKYDFFSDTCLFNCGSIIFTNFMGESDVETKKLIKNLEKYSLHMDIYKNDVVYKPYSPSKTFATTQYCIIWKKIYPNKFRRIITFDKINSCKITANNRNNFSWTISPVSCLHNIDNKIYKHIFRSLSTIIVDTQDIIRYNENMVPFTSSDKSIPSLTTSTDINYPVNKQINLFGKTILSFTVNINMIVGICLEFTESVGCINDINQDYMEVYFTEYKNLKLLPIRKSRSSYLSSTLPYYYHLSTELTNYICTQNDLSKKDILSQSEPICIGDLKSPYDICWYCVQPLYDDIYVIEKNINKAQIAMCKICFHFGSMNDIYFKFKKKFTMLRSKIPRNIYDAIDLMYRPNKVPYDEFNLYKKLLKIIHLQFPKKLKYYNETEITNIPINNEVVLCNNLEGIWNNINRIKKIKQKIIVPIRLTGC